MSRSNSLERGGQTHNSNALTHGLTCDKIFQAETAAYEEYVRRFTEQYEPATAMEEVLIARLARSAVRLQRAGTIDFQAFAQCFCPNGSNDDNGDWLSWDALAFKALVDTITRYEMAIGRSLIKTKHELERTIASRKGEMVPAPILVDFTW